MAATGGDTKPPFSRRSGRDGRRTRRICDADQRGQRATLSRRTRHADGGPHPAILDPRPAHQRAARAGLPAGARPPAGREPDRLPRHLRQGRPHPEPLPAPRCLALLWPQRGGRAALRLSRLEVRLRGRLRRHAERAGGEHLQGEGPGAGLSVRRAQRRRLGVHGPAADSAAAARHRAQHAGSRRVRRAEGVARVQLVPGPGGRHRHRPPELPAPRRRQAGRHEARQLRLLQRGRPRSRATRSSTRPSAPRTAPIAPRNPTRTTGASRTSCSRSTR